MKVGVEGPSSTPRFIPDVNSSSVSGAAPIPSPSQSVCAVGTPPLAQHETKIVCERGPGGRVWHKQYLRGDGFRRGDVATAHTAANGAKVCVANFPKSPLVLLSSTLSPPPTPFLHSPLFSSPGGGRIHIRPHFIHFTFSIFPPSPSLVGSLPVHSSSLFSHDPAIIIIITLSIVIIGTTSHL